MLCFILALKSSKVSTSWEKVSHLCESSLRSIYSQTDPDFKIILVCHESPILSYTFDERLEIINVNFPHPGTLIGKANMEDKWKKITVGMVRAGELRPHFVMIVDADDLVSCRLVEYTKNHSSADGWILKTGYRYRYGSKWIYKDDKFNCGTNAIINTNNIYFPKDLSEEERQKCILLTAGHTIIEEEMKVRGTPLSVLPFCGAVYVHSHGDNDARNYYNLPNINFISLRFLLGKLRRTRYLTPSIISEFGLDFKL